VPVPPSEPGKIALVFRPTTVDTSSAGTGPAIQPAPPANPPPFPAALLSAWSVAERMKRRSLSEPPNFRTGYSEVNFQRLAGRVNFQPVPLKLALMARMHGRRGRCSRSSQSWGRISAPATH
jgi:hypothetical protein